MKHLLICISVLVALGCASSGGSKWNPLSFGGDFKLRPYKDVTLKNGLKVILIEDNSLPYLSLGMLVRVGSIQDPKNMSGLTDEVAELLDKGTRQHTAIELSDTMAQYGGEFNASASKDATYISGSTLSFHEDEFIKQFGEIVTEASFPQNEVDRLRKRKTAELRQLVDEPEAVLEVSSEALLFPNHPYEKPVSGLLKDVKGIKKKEIIKHYLQYYRPSNAQLAVVGKFSPQIVEKLEKAFGGWTDRAVKAPEKFSFPTVPGQQIWIVDKGDLQQAQIRLAHEGIARKNADYIPLRLASVILGGGFLSRLMTEIRVKRGLTYSINSGFDVRLNQGPFEISTFTRHDKIGETVKETMRVLKDFHEQGPTEAELAEAKALLKGQFPRSLETPEALASSLLYLRFFGIPDSYLTTFNKEVDRLKLSDVKRVAAEYLHPENLKIIVHAPKRKAQPQLEGIAPIKVVPANQFL